MIVDTNVHGDVFPFGSSPDSRSVAGKQLFKWLDSPSGRMVIGGKYRRDELTQDDAFNTWLNEAMKDGRIRRIPDPDVDHEEQALISRGGLKSNDAHILALARVSKAGILYTRDERLRKDFKDSDFGPPGGLLYPDGESRNATGHRRRMLNRMDTCPHR